MTERIVSPDDIRARFSRAMSHMYRQEVPAYGTLCDLVAETNGRYLPHGTDDGQAGALARITEERHGAIRLGTARELHFMRRLFAVMGMHPVGYYDLSVAGLPVHSTAFRPVDAAALEKNPFRVFTSLLRVDLIDESLRGEVAAVLGARDVFTPAVRLLVEKAEVEGGLSEADSAAFIREALETFRWHDEALVSHEFYRRLSAAHPLIADIVSFKGPHINHLTPRTLDIDAVQRLMPERGMAPKETIEGPPHRDAPILLRQTSFKALNEPISFPAAGGGRIAGTHTARFGEIEQRGVALTPKGRALYDRLLAEAREMSRGKRTDAARRILVERFAAFPDDYATLREQGLAYFEYVPTGRRGRAARDGQIPVTADALVRMGLAAAHPIVYEDFLPVSAAGIFRSNLGQDGTGTFQVSPNKGAFEDALGAPMLDEFSLYADMERDSIRRCLETLLRPVRAA